MLALYWYAREYPTNRIYEQGLLRALHPHSQQGPEYHSEYLEVDRFPEPEQSSLLRTYLRQKYAHHPIDVIIATAETPLEFLIADRTLFAGVPIVFTGFGPPDATPARSGPDVTGVFIEGVYRRNVEAIRAIHPDTKQLLVITSLPNGGGTERESIVRSELSPFEKSLTIRYLTDRKTDALINEVSHAPANSVVLYVRHSEESANNGIDPAEAAALIARASSVPVYSIARTYFGRGIVGGYLVDHEAIGAQAGEVALRLLDGTPPEDTPSTNATLTPMFDWRALQRWGIDSDRLPIGAIVQYRSQGAWDQYRIYVIGAITLLLLQGVMIGALVVQRSRRRKVEGRNAAILNVVPDMMFLLSRDGVYLDYHAPNDDQLLLKPEFFIGRHMSEILPAGVAAQFAGAFARLAHEPGPLVVEYPMQMGGEPRYFEARVVRCRDTEVLAVVRDVTDRRRAEQTLHQAQADLSRLSRLTALGEFAASIAHEIRQPLTGILMNAKTCLRWLGGPSPDMSEVRAALSDVVEAGQRANEIIRRNRELFKLHTVQKTTLDLNGVIREVEALARSRLQAAHVILVTSMAADAPPVHGDRVELQQVLLNLIGNSIDAMEPVDPGSRRIEVSSAVTPNGRLKVSVRDTGVGLEGVDRERMFALSYTTKPSGSGVGLSISRSIVEAHGGQLWAEEDGGQGATFSFTLPVHSSIEASQIASV